MQFFLEKKRAATAENRPHSLIAEYEKILQVTEKYSIIEEHRSNADRQRKSYNMQKKNTSFLKNKLLIELDYKQKIIVGLSPRHINREFFELEQRVFLGFGIYYVDNNNEIKVINFNIITDNGNQDAMLTVQLFRIIRRQAFFKAIDQKKYVIWTDCGKTFRNKLFTGYLFKELKQEKIHGNYTYRKGLRITHVI